MGYKVKQTVFPSGTGLWQAVAAGELDFACESWPSYAEADDVMFNEDLINESNNIQHYISRSLYTGFRTIKIETLETSSMAL